MLLSVIYNDVCFFEFLSQQGSMFKYVPLLIDSFKYQFQRLLLNGTKYQYIDDNEKLFDFAQRLLQSAVMLEKKQSKAFEMTTVVNDILNLLKVCSLTDIATTTESIQHIVNQLQLQGADNNYNYYIDNVWMWIKLLNKKIENILLQRMNKVIIKYKKIQTYRNLSCSSNNTIHKIDMVFDNNINNDGGYNYSLSVEPFILCRHNAKIIHQADMNFPPHPSGKSTF